MGSYITLDEELQHTGWVKINVEMLPEDVETLLVKNQFTISNSGQISTFPEVFIFQKHLVSQHTSDARLEKLCIKRKLLGTNRIFIVVLVWMTDT